MWYSSFFENWGYRDTFPRCFMWSLAAPENGPCWGKLNWQLAHLQLGKCYKYLQIMDLAGRNEVDWLLMVPVIYRYRFICNHSCQENNPFIIWMDPKRNVMKSWSQLLTSWNSDIFVFWFLDIFQNNWLNLGYDIIKILGNLRGRHGRGAAKRTWTHTWTGQVWIDYTPVN